MSGFCETDISGERNGMETKNEANEIKLQERERPEWSYLADTSSLSDASEFDSALEKVGFLSEETENQSDKNIEKLPSEKYGEFLEKGDDGKYYDKETGREYASIEEWEKAQITLAKRYDSTAEFYENKAKKEWARFKNSEENGAAPSEKWEHYKTSQECYAKAKEYREKGERQWEKLGMERSD